jgi:predicted transcriptional regulator
LAATSLKLPDELKRRIAQLVEGSDRSAHALMIEAIEQAAQREELRRRFGDEAAQSEKASLQSGKAYDAAEAFKYLESRARGRRTRRPRMKAWRKSN